MKNKLLGLLTFGFISQFAMANGITGLPNGTFSGSGTWSGPLHMSGDYTNTTTIEGNNFLGLSFHKGKLNRIAFSTVFDESSGTFMVEMKGIEVGSGSCAVTDENVTTCEFSIPKKKLQETLIFSEGRLEKKGSQKVAGMHVSWHEVLFSSN